MGIEIRYDNNIRGVGVGQLDYEIDLYSDIKKRTETEIFGLIVSDPSKVRPKENDDESLNNVQYLLGQWEELKEIWKEAVLKISEYSSAREAVEEKTRTVDLCQDCMVEVDYKLDGLFSSVIVCPKCGKTFDREINDGNSTYPGIIKAEIKTFEESY